MADIKQVFAEIEAQFGEDTPEELKKVIGTAKEAIVSEFDTVSIKVERLTEDLKNVTAESMGRKEKIRELEPKVEELTTKLNGFNDIKQELDGLKEFKTKHIAERREAFAAWYDKHKDHKAFAKAKDFFTVPDSDNGSIDWEQLADLLEALDDPDAPLCQDDNPLDGNVVYYVLSSYQRSAYSLLMEGLRSGIIQGRVLSVKEWGHLRKPAEDSEKQG